MELNKIYEGWAEKKYPNDMLDFIKRTAYVKGCSDITNAVLKFADDFILGNKEWAVEFKNDNGERTWFNVVKNERKTTAELFAYFLEHIYNK